MVKVKPTHKKTFLASYENNLKSACAFTQSVQEFDPEMFHLHIAQWKNEVPDQNVQV